MFSRKTILTSIFIFVAAFSASAQKRAADEWSIADYFKNLPEKYKTFSGDFSPPSKETSVIDEQNGYAAYMNFPPGGNFEPFPIFEMAIFKSKTKPPLVVVSNLKSDSACSEYETFFLQRVGSKWTDVKREVLPPINLKMFWDAPQSVERLLKITKESFVSYHFDLPRRGTQVKASLEICDYFEDDAPETVGEEMSKLRDSAKTIRLDWDKQNGKFKLVK